MKETSEKTIIQLLEDQRAFFATNRTKELDFRIEQLENLKEVIQRYEEKIQEALWLDLRKSPEEVFLTELSLVLSELESHIKHLKKWMKPRSVSIPFFLRPSSSEIVYEPLGVSLIVAPWNYPFQLLFAPLIGSISAGGCAILKPSPNTPHIAKLMEEMIRETFNANYIALVQGGKETNTKLLKQKFDLIFFTGSPTVGKVVMKAAAEHLTPVILELGGKSPCIVDKDANIELAAKRIVFGKLMNAGQTCIAPDYLFVHHSVKDNLMKNIISSIQSMYGKNIKESRFYSRIVSHEAMKRLEGLMQEGTIYWGGEIDYEDKFIAPTIIDNVKPEYKIMQEEIFGPLLPIMTYKHIDEPLSYIHKNEKPLAFYYFGDSDNAKEILKKSTSGGACINDTLMQVVNHRLPFGGVGHSGMGRYHGKESFLAFTNRRSVVHAPTWVDVPFKYVPYNSFNIIKRVM